jgi:hypothetical protein
MAPAGSGYPVQIYGVKPLGGASPCRVGLVWFGSSRLCSEVAPSIGRPRVRICLRVAPRRCVRRGFGSHDRVVVWAGGPTTWFLEVCCDVSCGATAAQPQDSGGATLRRIPRPSVPVFGMPSDPAAAFGGGSAFNNGMVRMFVKLLGLDAPFHLLASCGSRRWPGQQRSLATNTAVASVV